MSKKGQPLSQKQKDAMAAGRARSKAMGAIGKPIVKVGPVYKPERIIRVDKPDTIKKLLDQQKTISQQKAKIKEQLMDFKRKEDTERATRKMQKSINESRIASSEGYPVRTVESFKRPFRDNPNASFFYATETKKTKRKFATKEARNKYVDSLGLTAFTSGLVAASAFGAMDYAGLSDALPIQKFLGVSLAGWIGGLSLVLAKWVFSSPMVKDGAYGVGLSLVAYEVSKQISSRFADWGQLGANWTGAVNEFEQSFSSEGPLMYGASFGAKKLMAANANNNRNLQAQMNAIAAQRNALAAQQAQMNQDAALLNAIAAQQAAA